ncbi:flagellar biosynthetic protein FliO [Melioribacteraceae bacterium 4301-Me]|uniref:flagellar biosynthetic protein FliO n=1 Tax=Pyranulibacter aquaticus TaxID=3163344 RepID=UPI00359855A3
MFIDILKMIFPLLVITALLGGALWFVKRYSTKSNIAASKEFTAKLISSQMIFPKRFVSVVKIKDKLLVLGITDHSITLLKEFDYPDNLEENFSNIQKQSFWEILKKNINPK